MARHRGSLAEQAADQALGINQPPFGAPRFIEGPGVYDNGRVEAVRVRGYYPPTRKFYDATDRVESLTWSDAVEQAAVQCTIVFNDTDGEASAVLNRLGMIWFIETRSPGGHFQERLRVIAWTATISENSTVEIVAYDSLLWLQIAKGLSFLYRKDKDHPKGWTACLPAGSLVLTETGLKSIEDIREGERVLTHRNRWRRVCWSGQTGVLPVVKVTGHGGQVRCTENHLFWSAEARPRGPRGRVVRTLESPRWREAGDMKAIGWASPRHVEPLDIPIPKRMSPALFPRFWWVIGRWVGDGWTDGHTRPSTAPGSRKKSTGVHICCGEHEADKLERLLAETGLHWGRKSVTRSVRFRYGHAGLWEWLREHFGDRAHNKRLPAWLLGASQEVREEFLDGYVSADGNRITDNFVRASTVSKELAVGLRILLATLGRSSGLYIARPEGLGVRDSYCLSWHEVNAGGKGTASMLDDDHVWTKARKVEREVSPVPVYDLHVEEDHSFVADGVVVHNSEIALDVIQRFKIPVAYTGRVTRAKGKTYRREGKTVHTKGQKATTTGQMRIVRTTFEIPYLHERSVSLYELLAGAYTIDRKHTGRHYYMISDHGRLAIIRKPSAVRILAITADQIRTYSFSRDLTQSFASVLIPLGADRTGKGTHNQRHGRVYESRARNNERTPKAGVKYYERGTEKPKNLKAIQATDAAALQFLFGSMPIGKKLRNIRDQEAFYDEAQKAIDALARSVKTITVTCEGNVMVQEGDRVQVRIPVSDTQVLKRDLFVKSATHSMTPGDYSMELELAWREKSVDLSVEVPSEDLHRSRGGEPGSGEHGSPTGQTVTGKVSWFNESENPGQGTAGGKSTSQPGIALNLHAGTEAGWNNATTQGWMAKSKAGHPVFARVEIGGHTADLPIIDLGPAASTGRAIDVTEGGVKALGFTTSNFPTDAIGHAKILG